MKGFNGWEVKDDVEIDGSYTSEIILFLRMSHIANNESSPPDISSHGISVFHCTLLTLDL